VPFAIFVDFVSCFRWRPRPHTPPLSPTFWLLPGSLEATSTFPIDNLAAEYESSRPYRRGSGNSLLIPAASIHVLLAPQWHTTTQSCSLRRQSRTAGQLFSAAMSSASVDLWGRRKAVSSRSCVTMAALFRFRLRADQQWHVGPPETRSVGNRRNNMSFSTA